MANRNQRFADAKKFFAVAVEEADKFSEDDERRPATNREFADYYLSRERYKECKPYYEQALILYQHQKGEDAEDLVPLRNKLVQIYFVVGEQEKAESLGVKAIEYSEKQIGADNPELAELLLIVAESYQKQKKQSEAEPLFLRALALEKSRPEAIKGTASVITNNIAIFYQNWGKYDLADSLFHLSIEMSEAEFGEGHSNLMPIITNLAGLYLTRGEPAVAESLYQVSLKIYKDNRMRAYFKKVDMLIGLAGACRAQDKIEKAAWQYKRALRLIDGGTGMHPKLLSILENYAMLLKKRGKNDEAKPLIERANKLRAGLKISVKH